VKVVIGARLSEEDLAALRSAAPNACICVAADREAALAEVPDAQAYVAGHWSDEVLAAGRKLRWVHFMWAGVDGVLSPALAQSDLTVTNSAGVFAIPMAEHAMALMLAFARGVHVCARRRPERAPAGHDDQWRHSIASRLGELCGATLGVVGYGKVGSATAQRAKAFGMRVLAVRRRPEEPAELADEVLAPDHLGELLGRSDYVLISCPLTPHTRGLIGQREFASMKPGAVIVNVARGAIVDEPALIEALRAGRIRGAALDATCEEPLPPDSPLWQMENVIVTPHVAGASPQTPRRQMECVRENLRRYAAGEPLLNVVDKRAGY
jgi:phosphoglycerate dehydrogenase-like enzyme